MKRFFLRFMITALCTKLCLSTVAQTDYRPAASKSTDHSYFKNGRINIINSSHRILPGWILLVPVQQITSVPTRETDETVTLNFIAGNDEKNRFNNK